MSIEDVKPQLIGALKKIGYAGRAAFFKEHSIQFAGAKAFWFGLGFASRTIDLIAKQLNARNSNSASQNKNGAAKSFEEFSQKLLNDLNPKVSNTTTDVAQTPDSLTPPQELAERHVDTMGLQANLYCVARLSSTINTQLNMLLQAICDLALTNPHVQITGKFNNGAASFTTIKIKNIEKELFIPFKESLTHSIQELNKLDTQDRETLQTAINEAKTNAKTRIASSIETAEQSIKDLGGNEFDPNNPNKKYIDLINQVKGLLFQARALIAIQGEPNFDELSKVVEVWAKEKIGIFSQTYNDNDSTILSELKDTISQLAKDKATVLQSIPQQAENKSALTALINNTLTAHEISDIADLASDTQRLEALNQKWTEKLQAEALQTNEEFLRENMQQ